MYKNSWKWFPENNLGVAPRKTEQLYLRDAIFELKCMTGGLRPDLPDVKDTTICVQPWSVNVFSHMFIFQTRQFPRQLCRLDQWKCFVWSTKLWMFVKETWHVLVTWSACSTKLTTFFRVLEAWCHHLRLQPKDGRAKCKQIWTNLSHWNTDGLSSRCEDLLFF